MAVTEQIDAIRALGADPVKKLVVPRLIASVIVMPVLGAFALVLGFAGAMGITSVQFDIPPGFFLRTSLGSVNFADYFSGMYKCPIFGAIIALTGCHFGLITRGGTEGVGQATTRTVVAISIAILIADFFLTKVSILIFPGTVTCAREPSAAPGPRGLLVALALAGCKGRAAPPAPHDTASATPAAEPSMSARRPVRRYYLARQATHCEILLRPTPIATRPSTSSRARSICRSASASGSPARRASGRAVPPTACCPWSAPIR